jgi:hypothetical protein
MTFIQHLLLHRPVSNQILVKHNLRGPNLKAAATSIKMDGQILWPVPL